MSTIVTVSVLADTAAAVLTELEETTFSLPFDPVRSYADWELKLEDAAPANAVLVDVVPVSSPDFELETRGSVVYRPQVDIVVRKRLGDESKDASGRLIVLVVDELVYLVEEIAEHFACNRFELAEHQPIWQATEILSAYMPSHIRQFQQFTGVVRLTFSASVDLDLPLSNPQPPDEED